jgi:multimeric flavodoxin WrbA
MRAFIINGAKDRLEFTAEIGRRAETALRKGNWDVEICNVWEKKIGYCLACGICGNKTPGICAQKDDGRIIAERMAECDLMVFISRVTFGGYSTTARQAIERTLPNVHPLFRKYRGELHHRYRYRKSPSLLVLGWQEESNSQEALLFRKFAERNAVNFLSPKHSSLIISGQPEPQVLENRIADTLEKMDRQSWETSPILPFPSPDAGPFGDLSTPVALVSASNRRNSNSKAIMEYAAKKMEEAGAKCITLDLPSSGFLQGNSRALTDVVRSTGRILLISSLYHDGLNYVATKALETLAGCQLEFPSRVFFSAVIHSGYPEPVHTRTALAACRQFTEKMGWHWQGGLTAGATSPIGGQPLEKAGGFSKNLRLGLDLAVRALVQGQPIPENAVRAAGKFPIPPLFFLWAANYMTRKSARKAGLLDIGARPYEKL